ncbi:MAG: endonuclease/exonuclease/phosphatase family protein [Nanoarchaeota archaeon]|nr:endonuclease/exonuclease/phosphatase family protein [Nanoarchaeota archaeon]MBU1644013.1 endonuclease/exonuclease/phosphatase family protein [Nanoarchaeota archaeon]MBU1976908.1 endonuclease/exonuclease/phosphatase family protein [Nanoarchaeota archaeon]
MSSNNSGQKKGLTRRNLLQGIGGTALIGLTSCLGSFKVINLNGSPDYQEYNSSEEVRELDFAFLNAADLRGDCSNLFNRITKTEALAHANKLAEILRGVDLVCLTEVDYKDSIKTGKLNQPEVIAKFMGSEYNYVVFDEFMKFPIPVWTTGNGMISKHPLKAVFRHPYGQEANEESGSVINRLSHLYKDFIHVEAKVGKRIVNTLVTHLSDNPRNNLRTTEINDLLSYITKLYEQNPNRHILVAGDFNCAPDSEIIQTLTSNGILSLAPDSGLKTYPSDKPLSSIDHILTHNIEVSELRTFYYPYSDHLGLRCRLKFP